MTAIDKTQRPLGDFRLARRHAERRTRRRLPLVLLARMTFQTGPDQASRTVVGRTRNVSSRGAYLILSEAFAPGQVVFLTLDVPPDQCRALAIEIQCDATVVRVEAAAPGRGDHGIASDSFVPPSPKTQPRAGVSFRERSPARL